MDDEDVPSDVESRARLQDMMLEMKNWGVFRHFQLEAEDHEERPPGMPGRG